MERNRIEFTGNIERLRSVPTKTGTPMARFFLKVGDSRFKILAFCNLAALVLAVGDGKEIGVLGVGSINSWRDDDGTWKNDFQCTAWSIEIDGETTDFEKSSGKPARQQPPTTTDEFSYRGGPF